MEYYNQPSSYGTSVSLVNTVMKKVYLRMFAGLLVSAFCALGVASSPSIAAVVVGNPIVYWAMFIGMFVMAMVIPARLNRMSSTTTFILFLLFSVLMGASLSSIFYVYTIASITQTFFIAAGVFGAMSVYGYLTRTDLSKMGTYLMMGLFGLIIACVVNIFWANNTFDWIISIVGVLLFVGLTAWDTQQVKRMAGMNMSADMSDKLATMGAMNLYLDFINLFLFLLRIFGGGRD